MPALNRLTATRIVAKPQALDAFSAPAGALVLRFAPDEMFITPPLASVEAIMALDEYAIVIDECSFSGVWLSMDEALERLPYHCEWELPTERPAFAQGAVAGVPTKLWFGHDQVLLMVSSPFSAEMEERFV